MPRLGHTHETEHLPQQGSHVKLGRYNDAGAGHNMGPLSRLAHVPHRHGHPQQPAEGHPPPIVPGYGPGVSHQGSPRYLQHGHAGGYHSLATAYQ